VTTSARISWSLSPQALADAAATSSLWRVTQIILAALIEAIVPPITLAMLRQPSPQFHKRLANPQAQAKTGGQLPAGEAVLVPMGVSPVGVGGLTTPSTVFARHRTNAVRTLIPLCQ
jgi:hypothetical protein